MRRLTPGPRRRGERNSGGNRERISVTKIECLYKRQPKLWILWWSWSLQRCAVRSQPLLILPFRSSFNVISLIIRIILPLLQLRPLLPNPNSDIRRCSGPAKLRLQPMLAVIRFIPEKLPELGALPLNDKEL